MNQKDCWNRFRLVPENPPNEGILFVDHSREGRSGHLGHALVEYEDNKILAFYPNVSDDNEGHSAVGWMEYKRSEDGGNTWSGPHVLEYSKGVFDQGRTTSVFSEKAVRANDGTIVLFNLVCDLTTKPQGYRSLHAWAPHWVPTYIRSRDGGRSWTEARNLGDQRGRVWDAINYGEDILVLQLFNDASVNWKGNTDDHVYCLYASTDNGESFSRRSLLPLDTRDRGYGAMGVLEDGSIIVYVYHVEDERRPDYIISKDGGVTWSETKKAYFDKKIRNPQMARFGDCYFMHGRSGTFGEGKGHLVLYTSPDGITWDKGIYLRMQEAGRGAYSNNLLTGTLNPDRPRRLLIQASHAYELSKTNVSHWWIEGK